MLTFTAGDRLGPYEILCRIGVGGMGEVWKARDTRLGREVAIKVSAEKFSDRFEREARTIATLNHPNICTLYDVGPNYLVMELIEGPTLAERIKEGALPLSDALAIAQQVIAALEAAHEKGIVHRDLKPGNIKIKPDGSVKVLDFGLAKATGAQTAASPTGPASPEQSPTISMAATQAGVILGTAAYMSPEQARGKPVDKRADIWAFGVVLYEMVTAKRPFQGEDLTETLASVVKEEPKLDQAPARVRRLLRKCLEKDPKKRLRDIADAWELLEGPREDESAAPLQPRLGKESRPGMAGWIAAGVLAVGLATVAFLRFREKPPAPAAPVRFEIPVPGNAAPTAFPSLSPDGRKLAFVAGGRLWVHFLESGETRDLTAMENAPFWSPDSRFVASQFENKIKKIEVTGGPLQIVSEFSGTWEGGAWSQDDVMVFGAAPGGLFRVPASGGVPVQITSLDPARKDRLHGAPSFLPDGRHFVYDRVSADRQNSGICLGSVDASPEQQSGKVLVASNWAPRYAPSADPSTGYLLFIRESTLMAQPFDNRRLELKGQAVPLAEQVGDSAGGTGGIGAFSASSNDVLVFQRGGAMLERQLTWFDREGKVLGTAGAPGDFQGLALSPDGTRVALIKRSGQASNIWLLDFARDASTRFTFGSARDVDPVWSPDGSSIVFTSGSDLYQKQASGAKDAEVVLTSSEIKHATSWSHGFLLYTVVSPKTKTDIWVLPMVGNHKPVPFLATEFAERQAHFSPDGHWVAYASDAAGPSGHPEIYVRSFSMNSAGTAVETGGQWLISNGGGFEPRWRGDGRELYYRSYPDGKLMAVEIATMPVFRPGKPQALSPMAMLRGGVVYSAGPWDAAADGKRFLAPAPRSGPEPFTVVLNWTSLLKPHP